MACFSLYKITFAFSYIGRKNFINYPFLSAAILYYCVNLYMHYALALQMINVIGIYIKVLCGSLDLAYFRGPRLLSLGDILTYLERWNFIFQQCIIQPNPLRTHGALIRLQGTFAFKTVLRLSLLSFHFF